MADIGLTSVSKHFGEAVALHGVDTQFKDGEFVALLGPSGCGKTTLLRLLAGFETPSSGAITLGDRLVADAGTGRFVPPEDRNIGFVFQAYALWPHMSVRRNVSYPLEVRGLSRTARESGVKAALEATGLAHLAERMPSELSGGQRQRVALARCLVSDPLAVLLDEPLANLDVALRASMQQVFQDFHARTKATMVYVTHDQSEAMAMADRVAVMSDGRIEQFDTPETLYARPKTRFVAEFVGEGVVHPIDEVVHSGESLSARLLGVRVRIQSQNPKDPRPVTHVCLRPENLSLGEAGALRARVLRSTYLGGRYRVALTTVNGERLLAESRIRLPDGTTLGVDITDPWAFREA